MTITASRIVAGTTREDDLDIVTELDRRLDYAITHGSIIDHGQRVAHARAEYEAAQRSYTAKWFGIGDGAGSGRFS